MIQLSLCVARTMLLAAQGLIEPTPAAVTKADVLAAIRRMGLLQIDTISVVARSPYLVLWSRLGAYEPQWLDELLADGALFEYWAHGVSFVPIEDYRLYRRRMLEYAEQYAADRARGAGHIETMDRVLAHIRENGAVRSAHFAREGKAGTWWDWKPEKIALELLYYAGALMIARREGFQRVYDLQERVLPGWDDLRTPSREDATRAFILKAVKALGVAEAPWVVTYFNGFLQHRNGGGKKQTQAVLEALARESALIRAQIEGSTAPAYIHPDNLPLVEHASAGTLRPSRTTLLSPFDPVTSDRDRAHKLFGFFYRIETYTPSEKRQYGYFTLPILYKNDLIGRLDAKAHRRQGLFEVKAIHLEPSITPTDEMVASLARTIKECAQWHKTPEIVVRRSEPAELTARLAAGCA